MCALDMCSQFNSTSCQVFHTVWIRWTESPDHDRIHSDTFQFFFLRSSCQYTWSIYIIRSNVNRTRPLSLSWWESCLTHSEDIIHFGSTNWSSDTSSEVSGSRLCFKTSPEQLRICLYDSIMMIWLADLCWTNFMLLKRNQSVWILKSYLFVHFLTWWKRLSIESLSESSHVDIIPCTSLRSLRYLVF